MEHAWSLLCSKAIIDQRTKMMSLIDVVDGLEITGQLPEVNQDSPINAGPIQIQIAGFWYRSDIDKPETGKFRIKLTGPNGRAYGAQAPTLELEVNLVNSSSSHSIVEVPALPYVGLGTYYFDIEQQNESGWSRVAHLPLQLRQKT
jgi:hypothetical protein